MQSCASFSAAEIFAPSSPCDSSSSLRICGTASCAPGIQAIRAAALPQGRLVQLQVLVRARGLRAIQQGSVLAGKLLVPVVLAGVRPAKDHRAQAAVAYGKRMIPDGSGSPVPEQIVRASALALGPARPACTKKKYCKRSNVAYIDA